MYTSKEYAEIEVRIGALKEVIKVSVVDADIPLLLGVDYQIKWGIVMDFGKSELSIRKSRETFKMNSKVMHWTLPIQKKKKLHTEARKLVFHADLCSMNRHMLRKHIRKVHKNLSHKSEEHLVKLFKMAEKDTKDVRSAIKDVFDTCNICKRFKKTPPRPRVAMPKANTTMKLCPWI